MIYETKLPLGRGVLVLHYFFVLSVWEVAYYIGSMEGIKMRFAHKILKEEWVDFESRHRDAIKRRTTRRTGRLEDDRTYKVAKNGATESVASFKHPVYERFIDMKKNYLGDVKNKWGTKQDVMTRRKGRAIHNRIIFGKLNPLSFRLMHELADNVKEYMRKRFAGKK